MADRLKLSAEITSAGRGKAGAERWAGPKAAHHTAPRSITLPLPLREQTTRRLGDGGRRIRLVRRLFLGYGLRKGGVDLSRNVALLFLGEMVLQRLDEDPAAGHTSPTSGTLRRLEQPLRERDCSLYGPVAWHAGSIPVYPEMGLEPGSPGL